MFSKFILLFARLLRKLKILKVINIKLPTKLNNITYYIPIYNELGIYNLNVSEQWMSQVLRHITWEENSVFIDVGVNIGQTLLKLKSLELDVDYYGFEPNPMCVNYVNTLIETNNWKNTYLIPAAISTKAGISILNLHHGDTDSAASMITDFREEASIAKKLYIAACTGNDVKEIIADKKVACIKIDVEGFELEVINSLADIIHNMSPAILLEVLPVYNADNHKRLNRQTELSQYLVSEKYSIYRIHKDKSDNFLSYEKVDDFGIHDQIEWCDYLLLPQEKQRLVLQYLG
jgi:FkbM family methyltransferase